MRECERECLRVSASAGNGEDADCHRSAGLSGDAVILVEGEVVGGGDGGECFAGIADHRFAILLSSAGTGG